MKAGGGFNSGFFWRRAKFKKAKGMTKLRDNSGEIVTEEGELACLCLVSALVIQPVLLCSVLMRFVHATGCGKHLFVICIPHGVFFVKLFLHALLHC